MASLPWVPWASNRTEILSPAQIERIVQMHKESKQNAVIYVLVVLALYLVALAILVGRYLQHERDLDLAVCLGQALERCAATCRRASGSAAAGSSANGPGSPAAAMATLGAPNGTTAAAHALGSAAAKQQEGSAASTAGGCARKLSLKLITSWAAPAPPLIWQPPRRSRPPRHPMTDDESSEASSPPYSPAPVATEGAGRACSSPSPEDDGDLRLQPRQAGAASADSDGPDGCALTTAAGTWPAACYTAHGRASPAVVSVMVCDLQDTQV